MYVGVGDRGDCLGKIKACGWTGMGIWGGRRGKRSEGEGEGSLTMRGKQVSVFCLPSS